MARRIALKVNIPMNCIVKATEAAREEHAQVVMAEQASKAKSNFLSSMSHEMRTPMNAIIGMAQIAAKTDEVEKLKYCLSNIESSSTHLLGLINDVLDMSKIEAGKLELDHTHINIEKMLVRVCNLIIEKIEQKDIRFNIALGINMRMHYMGDELRLSQVITNMLSNAVKFTPAGGAIELTVNEVLKGREHSVLHFAVRDTGIGITEEQMSRLFIAFEQAESGTTRKFGGTGLGLAISKSIVEKMGGHIWVESELGKGSVFSFDVKLERASQQEDAAILKHIHPSDLRLLIADSDDEARRYFKSVAGKYGISHVDDVASLEQAADLATAAREAHKPYDIIFMDYGFASAGSMEYIRASHITAGNDVVIMTTFTNWSRIADALNDIGIHKFLPKPLFPTAIMNTIDAIVGNTGKAHDIAPERGEVTPDFSSITVLFAEDVDINREIFIALLEDTRLHIDVAENGLIAVDMFSRDPDRYDMIVMDIQMPEMDGYEATKAIRSLEANRAKSIPIIAMTANVFKEDIDRCLEAGMTDHLAKPIELNMVIEKITRYHHSG